MLHSENWLDCIFYWQLHGVNHSLARKVGRRHRIDLGCHVRLPMWGAEIVLPNRLKVGAQHYTARLCEHAQGSPRACVALSFSYQSMSFQISCLHLITCASGCSTIMHGTGISPSLQPSPLSSGRLPSLCSPPNKDINVLSRCMPLCPVTDLTAPALCVWEPCHLAPEPRPRGSCGRCFPSSHTHANISP